ncbi:uncharacterized protein ATC70_012688 [Mucor velutinosus]|uniref:Uncharacterized protein n=1 Tax=Mucor velutinosus TaxID=708070 RepID=A0AAN7D5X3_9FUNG|nr:hypothetical protein ATC70_012688 [Mucor velutinosus]
MYSHNNNSSHPDPFAGQYPPPPPLQSPVVEHPPTTAAGAYYQEPSYPVYSTSTPPILSQPQVETYVPLPPPPPVVNDYYQQPYSHRLDEESHVQGVNDYNDPHGQSLDEYLRQEREEYLRQSQQPTSYHNEFAASPPVPDVTNVSPRPNQTIPLNSFAKEDYEEAEKTPMVQKPILSKKEQKKLDKMQKNQQYQPYLARPTLAPENEAETYKYRPTQEKDRGGCNCCCYNPAITCCSFFCLLVSCAFVAAGVAMMIASKVVRDKCNNQCSSVAEAAQNACGTLCNTVLHDGLLYGGAVVAGLAGIAVIWKLIMWTCAGYSKR